MRGKTVLRLIVRTLIVGLILLLGGLVVLWLQLRPIPNNNALALGAEAKADTVIVEIAAVMEIRFWRDLPADPAATPDLIYRIRFE